MQIRVHVMPSVSAPLHTNPYQSVPIRKKKFAESKPPVSPNAAPDCPAIMFFSFFFRFRLDFYFLSDIFKS